MRAKLRTVSSIAAERIPAGKCIRREDGEFYGYYDGAQATFGHPSYQLAEEALDEYVYQVLRRQPAQAAA